MEKIIALLFLARDIAHREALLSSEAGESAVLHEFSRALVCEIDALAEMAQSVMPFDKLEFADNEFEGSIADVLEAQAAWLEDNVGEQKRSIDTRIGVTLGLFDRVVYRLRRGE